MASPKESTQSEVNHEIREILSLNADQDKLGKRPSFCMNEDERKQKSFEERRTDVDAAIEWIKKEIVSRPSAARSFFE